MMRLRRIGAGGHDPHLAAGLDPIDTAVARRALDVIAGTTPVEPGAWHALTDPTAEEKGQKPFSVKRWDSDRVSAKAHSRCSAWVRFRWPHVTSRAVKWHAHRRSRDIAAVSTDWLLPVAVFGSNDYGRTHVR